MSIKLGVLISGSGTNLQAIIDAIDSDQLDASVEIVISSREDAFGLKRAQAANIPTMALARELYDNPYTADEIIATQLSHIGCDYVVLAGYMRMVGEPILAAFPDRVINIHPALLPSFAGAHGMADAFAYGVKVAGVTVHFANEVYDEGPIIAQRAIEIEEGEIFEFFEGRLHDVEHELYPEVLQMLAEGRVSITTNKSGRRVVQIAPKAGLF